MLPVRWESVPLGNAALVAFSDRAQRMRSHLENLQALRGIACLMVVLYHLAYWDGLYGANTFFLIPFRWFGFAGVDLFFVLSGFLITSTNIDRFGKPRAIPEYLARRFGRIYPAYWAAMLATAVTVGPLLNWQITSSGWLKDFALLMTVTPYAPPNTVVGQAWTLGYELLFYLVLGVCLLVPPRWAGVGLALWAVAVIAGLFAEKPNDPFLQMVLSPFVLEFLAGCAIAALAYNLKNLPGWHWVVGAATIYALMTATLINSSTTTPYAALMAEPGPRVVVFGLPAAFLVYAAIAAERTGVWYLPVWLRRVGDASYSIYLTHFSVLLVAVWIGTFTSHSRWPHLAWLVISLVACLAFGFAFHFAIERPMNAVVVRLSKRLRWNGQGMQSSP